MFEFDKILEFLSQNTDWINWAAFILVFMESLIIVGLFTPATLIVPGIGVLAASVGIGPLEIFLYAASVMITAFFLRRIISTGFFSFIPQGLFMYDNNILIHFNDNFEFVYNITFKLYFIFNILKYASNTNIPGRKIHSNVEKILS